MILDICGLYLLYQIKPCVSHVLIYFLKSHHPNGEVACRCQVMPSLLVAKPQAWSPASSTAWTQVKTEVLSTQQLFYNNINHGSPLEPIRKALHLMKPHFSWKGSTVRGQSWKYLFLPCGTLWNNPCSTNTAKRGGCQKKLSNWNQQKSSMSIDWLDLNPILIGI